LNHSLCLKKKWRIEKTLLFMRFSYWDKFTYLR
jgi:hypothetical protein